MTGTLAGELAIITGAALGLGNAVARAYAEAGMRLAIMDVQVEPLENVAEQLRGIGAECLAIRADLADLAETQAAIEGALAFGGTPRVLVHNAAILRPLPFAETSLSEWQATVNVGLQAAYILTHPVWLKMMEAGEGSIVYVSSQSGIKGFADEAAYCTAKHGLEGLMKSLALEGAEHNIAVNTVTPGMAMHTPMSERNYPEELRAKWVDPILLTPAFVHLAQQGADGITGQRISAWDLSLSQSYN